MKLEADDEIYRILKMKGYTNENQRQRTGRSSGQQGELYP